MNLNEKIIDIKDLRYEYSGEDGKKSTALDGVSFSVNKGELISILGHNGSGKSTLAKLLNAQITPTDGEIEIFGINTKDENRVWDIRQKCAMVFQNPDNQLVATVVEEDVAFGPENLGVPSAEIRERVDEALEIVEMQEYKKHSPHMLSGGQKQRVAIAGILAMKPDILILDEPTAGLDPKGRDELFFQIKRLYEKNNITIVLISHSMEDVAKLVNRIIIMKNGHIHLDKSTKEAFSDVDDLKRVGLNVPQITELMDILRKKGHHFSKNILTVDEAFNEIKRELRKN